MRTTAIIFGVLAAVLAHSSDALAGPDRQKDKARGKAGMVVQPVVLVGPHEIVEPVRTRYQSRVHRHAPRPRQRERMRFVPGHYELHIERVLIPGTYRDEFVPAVYRERRGPFGVIRRELIRPACTRRIRVPARWEDRTVKIWVPGTWVAVRTGAPHRR
jgi:hypothetical protein